MDNQQLSETTAAIVAAYVSHHSLRPDDLSKLIGDIHLALKRAPEAASQLNPPPQKPAVPIKKSVTADYVVCLEDGKKFKSLKRHLSGMHATTPADYRAKWGLPRDYPMTAPNYSKARSSLAKSLGLGRKAPAAGEGSPERKPSKKRAAAVRKRPEKKSAPAARKRARRAKAKS